jgi:tetratricopeptide (TPR) repeat protein
MCLLDVQYDRAIDVARDMLELEPNSPWPPFVRGIAYRAKYERGVADRTVEPVILADFAEQSIAAHLKAVELAPGTDYFRGWLGLAFGVCGRTAEARAVLEQVRRSDRYNLPTTFGHIHLGLGELDAAFEWFDRAVEERDQNMMPILSYGHWDPIRNDPRFADLLRKMNLRVSRD